MRGTLAKIFMFGGFAQDYGHRVSLKSRTSELVPADLTKRPAHMFLTKHRFGPGQGHRVWLTIPDQRAGEPRT